MKSTPLITVLMPCYNALPYLTEALDSIVNQTYTNLEVLCINDGSTDGTAEVLKEYAKNDTRIRVIHNEQNIKLIKTLNKGIDLSNGKYIARMDADDISLPNRIEILYNKIQEHNVDVISSGYSVINENNHKINNHIPICTSSKSIEYASFFVTPIAHACSLIKKDCLNEVRYRNKEKYLHTEDYRLWTELLEKNKKIINITNILYKIRNNSNSVSHKYEDLQKKNFYHTLQEYNNTMGFNCNINIAKIIGLRIDKRVTPNDLKLAIKHKNNITNSYTNETNNNEQQEIITFHKYISLSIILQAIKRGTIKVKFFAIYSFIKQPIFNIYIWKLVCNRIN